MRRNCDSPRREHDEDCLMEGRVGGKVGRGRWEGRSRRNSCKGKKEREGGGRMQYPEWKEEA